MRYDELDSDEKLIINGYRQLAKSEKQAVLASKQSLKNWLQTTLSSIWNKVSSFFDDFWSWFKGAVTPKGKFHQVWVEHNEVDENGTTGMKIHAKFDVDNVKDIPCGAAVYFHYSSGEKLKDFNNSYRTTAGQVSVGKDFTPAYEGSIYNDFEIFMPSSELHLGNGKYDLKFDIRLYVKGGDFFAESNWVYFTCG